MIAPHDGFPTFVMRIIQVFNESGGPSHSVATLLFSWGTHSGENNKPSAILLMRHLGSPVQKVNKQVYRGD